jgi:hypothetical protein
VADEQTTSVEEQVEKAMDVYRGLTDAEREQVFRNMVRAVAVFGRKRDVDPLVSFADDIAMTVRLRLVPGYQDAVHDAQTRLWDPAEGLDVDEVLKQP